MASTPPGVARCTFYRRTKVSDVPGFRYDMMTLDTWDSGAFQTMHVPVEGDRILLSPRHPEEMTGVYAVIARSWSYPGYGSHDWPLGQPFPDKGPMVDIIVEPSVGVFVNEVAGAEDDED